MAFKNFLKRKDVELSFDRYGLDAVSALALGLFASLLIGTIVSTLAEQLTLAFGAHALIEILAEMGKFAFQAAGPAMAISVAYALHAPQLVLYTMTAVGLAANSYGGAGGPLAVLLVTIVATEAGKLVSRESRLDILITPFVTLFVGLALSIYLAPAIGRGAAAVGLAIREATELQPFFMGVLVSVLVGLALTLPISSAAICAALSLTGLAGGAALAGCCAQMVGFAVYTFRENGVAGLVAQGLGTSMLQFRNIMRKPIIWLPPTLASAITGPLATCFFGLEMNGPPIAAGMGTCGLVGPIGVLTGWFKEGASASDAGCVLGSGAAGVFPSKCDYLGLFLIAFLLPALLSWIFGLIMRKRGWIKSQDLKLGL